MKHALTLPILFYRLLLSPLIGPRCRHQPTCSEYALIALRRHGAWAGFWLGLSRIARCHPWGSSGYDPPPEHVGRHGLKFWRHGDWSWDERPLKPTSDIEPSQAEDHP